MSATPTEESHQPTGRTIDLAAEVRRLWGAEWNKPELEYEFSDGRKFYRRTDEAGPYA